MVCFQSLCFIFSFLFWKILDLKKLYSELLRSPHQASSNVDTLQNYSSVIKTKKLILVELQTLLEFPHFSNIILFLFPDTIWKHLTLHFKIGLIVLLCIYCTCFLCVLDINLLPDTWFANIFSHSVEFLFTFFLVSFEVQIFKILMKCNYFWLPMFLVLYPKKSLPNPTWWSFSSVFF